VLDANPSLPDLPALPDLSADLERLDADSDGVTCEALFAKPDADQQVAIHPAGGVATGIAGPAVSHGAPSLLLAGLLTGAGLVGLRRVQRS
jgi:hypothetical protein